MRFKEFYNQNKNACINEALITFGKKAYPKFGNIVILAGGGGSGKGFIQSQLLGIEGKTFDVDAMKSMVKKISNYNISDMEGLSKEQSSLVKSKIKEKIGNISHLDLTVPANVSKMHKIIVELGLEKIQKNTMANSIALAPADRKPNLIFDTTLRDPKKLKDVSMLASKMGYPKENIHIVWVLNDIEIALKQNKGRSRIVPEDILIDAHSNVAKTMECIMYSCADYKKYMDGVIAIVFNRFQKDATVYKSQVPKDVAIKIAQNLGIKKVNPDAFSAPISINEAFYVIAKEKGKPAKKQKVLFKETIKKMIFFMKKTDKERTEYWLDIIKDTTKWIHALRKGQLSADKERQKYFDLLKKKK